MNQMLRYLSLVSVILVVLITAGSGPRAGAQDDAEPTISALKTRVVDLKETAEARGDKINEQRTRIAELEAQVPTTVPAPTAIPTRSAQDTAATVLTPGLELVYFNLIDSSDALFVVGETRNTTDVPIDGPTLLFTLYDEAGNVLTTARAQSLFLVIPPGQTMPFSGSPEDDSIRSTDLGLAEPALCTYGDGGTFATDPDYSYAGLELRNVEEVEVSPGQFRVTGEVFNGSDLPASRVYVRAAIYGRDGGYVGDVSEGIEADIPAGRSARFAVDDGVELFRFPSALDLAGSSYTYELFVSRDSGVRVSFC